MKNSGLLLPALGLGAVVGLVGLIASSGGGASGGGAGCARRPLLDVAPGDETRWSQAHKLTLVEPGWPLTELLDELRGQGWRPHLVYTWRALGTQGQLFAAGASGVPFGFHCAVRDGKPAALAADIIDQRHGWGAEQPDAERTRQAAAFFQALGSATRRRGWTWGGDWSRKNGWAAYGMGWDPCHIQLPANSALPAVQARSLPHILGRPAATRAGKGGYSYHLWPGGWAQVAAGPAAVGTLIPPNTSAARQVAAEVGQVECR